MTVKEIIQTLSVFDDDFEVAIDADWDDTIHPVTEIYMDLRTNKVVLTA